MKTMFTSLLVISIVFIPFYVTSALIERGGGMVYDDVLNVTWLQDAHLSGNKLNQTEANMWVDELNYGGFNDWRLPTLRHSVGVNNEKSGFDFDCGTGRFDMDASGCDFGWSSTSVTHELAFMFYVNLGNLASFDHEGNYASSGGLVNISSFINLKSSSYWYGNGTGNGDNTGFFFATSTGGQYQLDTSIKLNVWALRDGDVTQEVVNAPKDNLFEVPAPSIPSVLLLSFGLIGLRNTVCKTS